MMKTTCLICDGLLQFQKDTILNEIILCDDCGTELEVISIDPPKVAEAPMEEEDWGQ